MNTIKTLLAVAALSAVSTASFAADDSPAANRVQQSISEPLISHQVVSDTVPSVVAVQDTFADSGMSVAAGRVQKAINAEHIEGKSRVMLADRQDVTNDSGKSVAATRVENALNESA